MKNKTPYKIFVANFFCFCEEIREKVGFFFFFFSFFSFLFLSGWLKGFEESRTCFDLFLPLPF